MILNLIAPQDPRLRQPTQRFDFTNPPMDPVELCDNLIETMVAKRGVGLSANQVGIPYSVFVIGHPDVPEDIITVFNPTMVSEDTHIVLAEEGCLSFEGLFVKIKRPESIRARFTSDRGETDTVRLSGFTARAFQHEYDHLQGTVFTDIASRYHLDQGRRQQKQLMKLRKRNAA
jgi:peptide deformylase